MDKTSAIIILSAVGIVCLCVTVISYKWLNNQSESIWDWYTYNTKQQNGLYRGIKLVNDPT